MTNRIKHSAKIRTKRKPARQYDPTTGRFLSVDPMWESFPNYNPYHYCYNNPVSFKDPTGLAPEGEKEDEIQSKQKEDELQSQIPYVMRQLECMKEYYIMFDFYFNNKNLPNDWYITDDMRGDPKLLVESGGGSGWGGDEGGFNPSPVETNGGKFNHSGGEPTDRTAGSTNTAGSVHTYNSGTDFFSHSKSTDYIMKNGINIPIGTYETRQDLKSQYIKSYERYYQFNGNSRKGVAWQEDGWAFTKSGGMEWGDGQTYGYTDNNGGKRFRILDFIDKFKLHHIMMGFGHIHPGEADENFHPSNCVDYPDCGDMGVAKFWGEQIPIHYIVNMMKGAVNYQPTKPIPIGINSKIWIIFFNANSSDILLKMEFQEFLNLGGQ